VPVRALGLAVALATLGSGCARVKPWQRGRLAGATMVVPLGETPLAASYRAKLLESKAGGGVPGVAAGGGCGCTQ
jgi:hypothetical protein